MSLSHIAHTHRVCHLHCSMSTVSKSPQRGGTRLRIRSVKSGQTGTKSVKMRKCREVKLGDGSSDLALPTLRHSCSHTAGSFSSLPSVST